MPFDSATYEIDPLTLTTPKARLEYLKDFLRRLPEGRFQMESYFASDGEFLSVGLPAGEIVSQCGTAACIAGWAVAKFAPQTRHNHAVDDRAAELLGVSGRSADLLFRPAGWDVGRRYLPSQAADVLDHLIRTGEVDWSVARKAEAI